MEIGNLLHKWNVENDQASFQLVRLVGCGLYSPASSFEVIARPHVKLRTAPRNNSVRPSVCYTALAVLCQ